MKTLIFGHKNPDTDSIASAISFSYLQTKLGVENEAVALGEPSDETKFALDYFKFEPLRVIETAANETSKVMLVDHNEFQQSVSDIRDVEIVSVVDHHRIANFETANPLYYRSEPVGCSNTIIYKLFKENHIEIPANIAGIMLSAIISDTLLFKSPTCTPEDTHAAQQLAKIANVDVEEYGLELLKAGTKLSDKTVEVILDLDAKSFPIADTNLRIAQVNTVDISDVFDRQAEFEAKMLEENEKNNFDLFILVVTNILDNSSELLAIGNKQELIKEAFEKELENNRVNLPNVISRKKQVVPPLTNACNK